MKTWLKVSIALLIVILLGIIGYFVFSGWQKNNEMPSDNNQEKNTEIENIENQNQSNDWQKPLNNNGEVIDSSTLYGDQKNLTADEKELLNKAQVEQISKSFVEVFGSYSTDTHYQNLYDLEGMLTSNYWAQLESYISEEEVSEAYSIWTKVLKAKVQKLNDDSAQVLVKTQRGERENKQSPEKEFYQEAEVFLLKDDGLWLINKVNWLD